MLMSVAAKGTKYPKSVKNPSDVSRMLMPGSNNKKLGGVVTKGRLKGYRIYSLSLEERATCPSTCFHWTNCYGNNMPFAYRFDHTAPEFLDLLEAEIQTLMWQHPKGVLVRLHVLGDFYSVEYVQFWKRMLIAHPKLAVWGYTAHDINFGNGTGYFIDTLNQVYSQQWAVRMSNGEDLMGEMGTRPIKHEADCPKNAFVCPEQTGKVKSCGACGACWSTTKHVAFLEH